MFLLQTDWDLRLACLLLFAFDCEKNFWQLYGDFLPSADECTSLLLASEVSLTTTVFFHVVPFISMQCWFVFTPWMGNHLGGILSINSWLSTCLLLFNSLNKLLAHLLLLSDVDRCVQALFSSIVWPEGTLFTWKFFYSPLNTCILLWNYKSTLWQTFSMVGFEDIKQYIFLQVITLFSVIQWNS